MYWLCLLGCCGWGGRVVVLQPEVRRFDPQSSPSKCRSALGQDTEPLNGRFTSLLFTCHSLMTFCYIAGTVSCEISVLYLWCNLAQQTNTIRWCNSEGYTHTHRPRPRTVTHRQDLGLVITWEGAWEHGRTEQVSFNSFYKRYTFTLSILVLTSVCWSHGFKFVSSRLGTDVVSIGSPETDVNSSCGTNC